MSTYPQGVSTFIPDYQAYQPDFNFAANVLQLKQNQYDQNWQKLNNMYGQLLNAPLTHDESIAKRDNTFKRIDFDLKRVTGLDLSLEQNVQQAGQLFRPFYEDSSLMKDMVFTKNVGFERALGDGKRYSSDEKVRDQYWADGLRAIDYKVQEFKETPYDQLPGFGDVKYTPYVNIEKKARQIAKEMDLSIDITTPQGDWIVRQKNGEQAIAPIQSVFYSALGKDPLIKEMYATQAYVKRKDYVAGNMNNPDFNGDPILAEKSYLNSSLNMLRKQTELTKRSLVNEKSVNDNIIKKLEQSIKDGTDRGTTEETIQQYKDANANIEDMMQAVDTDLGLISNNINKTLTTTGGSELSLDDINEMRMRVDASMASTMMQADLDKTARDFANTGVIVDYEANPFAVNRQKYQYDSALIQQRASAQKDVAYFKAQLDAEKEANASIKKAKVDSGMYDVDPQTGELKMKPELAEVQAISEMLAKTGKTDPKKLNATIEELYKGDAKTAKNLVVEILTELNEEGTLKNSDLLDIMSDKKYSGFNMKPFLKWLESDAAKAPAKGKGVYGTLDQQMKDMLTEEAMYTTSLEKEMMIEGDAGGEEAKAKLASMKKGSLEDVSPEAITRMTKRMLTKIEQLSDLPQIYNDPKIKNLVSMSHTLDDYASYRKELWNYKKQMAQDISNKMAAKGFNYGEYMFDDELNFVSSKEEFVKNLMKHKPNDIITGNGMSWGGYANAIMGAGTAGGIGGSAVGGVGAIPGFLGGLAVGAVAYPAAGLFEWGYNAIFGDEVDGTELVNGNTSWTGHTYTTGEEYDAMLEAYDDLVSDSELSIPVLGLNGGVGTGLYTANGAGITVEPGIKSPTYNMFLEVTKALDKNAKFGDTGDSYITFKGVNSTRDDYDETQLQNNAEAFNAIYRDMKALAGVKGKDLGRFEVGVSPFGGEDVGNAAVTFYPSADFLKKYKPDEKSNIWGESLEEGTTAYEEALKNGITVITNAKNLSNVSLYKNSYQTTEQIRIEKAGKTGVTYTDPTLPGYKINYRVDPGDNKNMIVTQTYPQYMGEGQYELVNSVTRLANQGTNIKYYRDRFFKETAYQIAARQEELRRTYK